MAIHSVTPRAKAQVEDRAARDVLLFLGPLVDQPQGRQLALPLAAADPSAPLAAPPPGFPVQQVVGAGLVPVPAALPQEGENTR